MKILVATVDEMKALIPEKYYKDVIITGIGILNVLKTIREKVSPMDLIVNVGYAGSKGIPVGSVCQVKYCKPYQVNNIDEGSFEFNTLPNYATTNLYTSTDFLTSSELDENFLVDMEGLAYSILDNKKYSIKIVSDNLNLEDYGTALDEDYTQKIGKILVMIEGENSECKKGS